MVIFITLMFQTTIFLISQLHHALPNSAKKYNSHEKSCDSGILAHQGSNVIRKNLKKYDM